MNGLFFSDGVETSTNRRQFLRTMALGCGAMALLGNSAIASVTKKDKQAAAPKSSVLPTALVRDEMSRFHVPPGHRPECPERYDALLGALKQTRFFSVLKPYQARSATDAEILACHSRAYLARVRRDIESGASRLSTGDTYVCRKSLGAAHYACGGACVAVDAVLRGEAKNAFCLVRPPGHHAGVNGSMGFCVFNNAAIAARYAMRQYSIGKIMIVDWDVHHGNGTQEIFYDEDAVFYFSTHQYPWYPWKSGGRGECGRGKGLGSNLNCPMPRGAGRKEFFAAFHHDLAPAFDRFKPEMVILSSGFDARHGDPLGRLELTDTDYYDLTGLLLDMARDHCQGRVVSILEGGYSLTGLATAAVAHIDRLQQG